MYEVFRAVHIIFVIAWMAGLLIYPRLLAYRLEGEGNAQLEAMMDKAAASTRKIILMPSLIVVWLMGLAMLGHQWTYLSQQPWIWGKLLLVFGLSGFQGWLMGVGRKVAKGEKPIAAKKLRMLNEIPMLVAIAAVLLVVLQPFAR